MGCTHVMYEEKKRRSALIKRPSANPRRAVPRYSQNKSYADAKIKAALIKSGMLHKAAARYLLETMTSNSRLSKENTLISISFFFPSQKTLRLQFFSVVLDNFFETVSALSNQRVQLSQLLHGTSKLYFMFAKGRNSSKTFCSCFKS